MVRDQQWRDVLPLPLIEVPAEGDSTVRAKFCWLWLLVVVLNMSYLGASSFWSLHESTATEAQCAAMDKLEEH
eukprot:2393507-Karenia_brevis.AAC.1